MSSIRYADPVKTFPTLAVAGILMLLPGCSVEINASQAHAQIATSTDIQRDHEAAAARPDGAGMWVALRAIVPREDVRRVAHSEVYPGVYVVECSTGKFTNIGTGPRIDDIRFDDFDAISALLRKQPAKERYQMESLIFARQGNFRTPQCLQFRGGSYLGQKILETRIPLSPDAKLSGRFPQQTGHPLPAQTEPEADARGLAPES
jgi:hypothetical protein